MRHSSPGDHYLQSVAVTMASSGYVRLWDVGPEGGALELCYSCIGGAGFIDSSNCEVCSVPCGEALGPSVFLNLKLRMLGRSVSTAIHALVI